MLASDVCRDVGQSPNTPTNYPRGILTPDRRRRRSQRRQGDQSLKAVSFNPKAEFKVLDEI